MAGGCGAAIGAFVGAGTGALIASQGRRAAGVIIGGTAIVATMVAAAMVSHLASILRLIRKIPDVVDLQGLMDRERRTPCQNNITGTS